MTTILSSSSMMSGEPYARTIQPRTVETTRRAGGPAARRQPAGEDKKGTPKTEEEGKTGTEKTDRDRRIGKTKTVARQETTDGIGKKERHIQARTDRTRRNTSTNATYRQNQPDRQKKETNKRNTSQNRQNTTMKTHEHPT
ncbi:hypothetical protein MCC01966_10410 [Bifidobacteriaceae bacterium MCC01966]|nr:hypothetical protein MCC01966_10410 [Bifidobacteriaceae bacterium MCC01966]